MESALDQPDSPLRPLANEWGDLLFPMGSDAQFADAYAQTLTYALLLAHFEGAENLRPAAASEALRGGHALLADALRLLEVDSVQRRIADAYSVAGTSHSSSGPVENPLRGRPVALLL